MAKVKGVGAFSRLCLTISGKALNEPCLTTTMEPSQSLLRDLEKAAHSAFSTKAALEEGIWSVIISPR
ncbi:hypothetical protein RND71_035350 [Anisodus tanguticus]|uniref:Uncharacterized protein n=1 Tax=Anisodus tanguticus TaxID=243964 RepID=A0AAE1V1I2_9SOLA|nr:hypothetical protein RND71_035350 [Anisodus tanguticus]